MFSAKMSDSKILKGIIESVSALIDETYFVINENGLTLSAMDPSHIALMSMTLPAKLFAEYECSDAAKLGINLEDMTKIMKRAGASDAVEFKYAKDSEKFQVQLKGKGTRTFSMRLVDIDEEKIPPTAELDVQFSAKATFETGILDSAIKDAEIYCDTLTALLTKDGLKFSAEGEVGDIEYLLTQDHLKACEVNTERKDEKTGKITAISPAGGVFSLSFLKNIMKMSAISDDVTLHLAANAPLKAEFEICIEGKEDKGKVTYFLAPRIEESEPGSE